MSRFKILSMVRRDHISALSLPPVLIGYLLEKQCYAESLDDFEKAVRDRAPLLFPLTSGNTAAVAFGQTSNASPDTLSVSVTISTTTTTSISNISIATTVASSAIVPPPVIGDGAEVPSSPDRPTFTGHATDSPNLLGGARIVNNGQANSYTLASINGPRAPIPSNVVSNTLQQPTDSISPVAESPCASSNR
ncbi:unnamed protein product [Protopolystoma xenopodis]|uniref:Uncharacterized protein n=1 Tax=Protopolystoma xenopodis TaxID=117903 RepID=A0A448X8G6_9PLAT|nr:unnamed protein product [Protopolystoma xenopodis]